jgi:hypothetical protein
MLMKAINVQIPATVDAKLKAESKRRMVSKSAIAREALCQWVTEKALNINQAKAKTT